MNEKDHTATVVENVKPQELTLVDADVSALVSKDVTPIKDIPESEIKHAEELAMVIADKIIQGPDDRSALREAGRLGEEVQAKSNSEFTLLRTSLGRVIDRMKRGEKGVPDDLKRLRDIMDEINPYPALQQLKRAQTAGFLSRLFSRVPGVGKVLSNIAKRYESVQTQIDAIIQSLNAGCDKLLENSLEIEERYKNLKDMQRQLKLRSYQLQVLLRKLEGAKSEVGDATSLQALQKAIVRVVRRLQNLVATENAFAQFFVTMNVTMDNHENLRDAVLSMVNLTRPVLENGLALQIAQQDERQIASALAASQDYLGNLMQSIAEDSMDSAAEIAKVANEPLIRFQDLVM